MRLLLDAHLPPAIASQLARTGVDAVAMRDWMGGNYRVAPDHDLLSAAAVDERVLVTYDLRTIPSLLKEWAESGLDHAGVILVDERTIQPNDIGGLLAALHELMTMYATADWRNLVLFLRPASDG
ncbi:MAG: DUF5615 family PIN-like protein [Dehalococcoidia bacterium]